MVQPVRSQWRDCQIVVAVTALILFFQLGAAPLWDRDEPRNAGCAAEMMAAGDWVVPIFNAEIRTHKPVLLYWLMMGSYSIFGANEFAARLPSALLGIGTVFLTWQMGRTLFGAAVGRWAGLVLTSTIMFGVASRAATPDALLIFCSALSLALFVHFSFGERVGARGDDARRFPRSTYQAIAIYAAMGLGVLAKGPVGLVVPTAVIGMYLLIKRLDAVAMPTTWSQRAVWLLRPFHPAHFAKTCLAMRPVTAVMAACAVALPWYVWVTVRTGGVWTREFFLTHNLSRATDVMENHSGPPILFYVAAIMVGFFPWSIVTIPCGMHLWAEGKSSGENSKTRDAIIFLLCWVGVYVGLFSLASTKLPSYVTPCYPALAVLAGYFVHSWSTHGVAAVNFRRGWLKVGIGNLIAVGVLLMLALPIAATKFLPGSEWLGAVGIVPLIGGAICWRLHSQDNQQWATTSLALTAIAFSILLVGVVPAEIGRHRKYEELFALTAEHDGPVVAWGHLEPSWIFYGGRPIRDFGPDTRDEFEEFLQRNPKTLVISTPQRVEEASVHGKLFSDYLVVHETEYFLRDRPLLLVSPIEIRPIVADKSGVTGEQRLK